MARKITLRVLDGPSKGKSFIALSLPVSIGREPGNSILLNDERVSRYHLKILESSGKLLLSDTGSTNGTRLNGETVGAAEIHPGDIIALGRSVLIVGTREEIRTRLERLNELPATESVVRSFLDDDEWDDAPVSLRDEIEALGGLQGNPLERLQRLVPPPLPQGLDIEQFAQISDIFLYFQLRLRHLVDTGIQQLKAAPDGGSTSQVAFQLKDWQNLLDLYARTAKYLHDLNES